jgi:hypothetical protein
MVDDSIDEIAYLIRGLELATDSFLGDNGPRPASRPAPTPGDGNSSATRVETNLQSSSSSSHQRRTNHHSHIHSSDSQSSTGDMVRDDDDDLMGEAALAFLRLGEALRQEQAAAASSSATVPVDGVAPNAMTSPPSRPHSPAGNTSQHSLDYQRLHLSNISEASLARLAQRAEEEEQLNRAILMSLRSGPVGRRSRGISEQNIVALEAMGFERERAMQALQDSDDNVEDAAMQLLG